MIQEVRRRLRKFRDLRTQTRNFPSFNIGAGGTFEIDFAIRGPDLQALAAYGEKLRVQARTSAWWISTRPCGSTSLSCGWRSTVLAPLT